MISISVTTLDQYLRYLSDDEMTDEDLIERLTGKFKGNKFTELRTALHDILQNWNKRHKFYENHKKEIEYYFESINGITFTEDIIKSCLKHIKYDVPVFEVKEKKIYNTDFGEVLIVGKVDQLYLNSVQEIKSNWTYYKYDSYRDSIQWEFYLDMFQAKYCEYTVFEFGEKAGEIELKNTHNFKFFPYPTMLEHIHKVLNEFLEFIHNKNIQNHFIKK